MRMSYISSSYAQIRTQAKIMAKTQKSWHSHRKERGLLLGNRVALIQEEKTQ